RTYRKHGPRTAVLACRRTTTVMIEYHVYRAGRRELLAETHLHSTGHRWISHRSRPEEAAGRRHALRPRSRRLMAPRIAIERFRDFLLKDSKQELACGEKFAVAFDYARVVTRRGLQRKPGALLVR